MVAPTLLEKFDTEKAKTPAAEPATKPEGDSKPAEAVKAEAKPADPADPAAKPAEAAKPDAAQPAQPVVPAKPEPVEYAYTLPETLKLDDARRGELHSALDEFRADPKTNAQKLIDLHNKAMTEYADTVRREQIKIFNETTRGWETDAMADEQIGGAGHQTAMGMIARMRDEFVPEADRAAFNQFLNVTGAGSHPAFLRMMHNVGKMFDEAPPPPPGARPSPANGAKPGGRVRDLYTHPNSTTNRAS